MKKLVFVFLTSVFISCQHKPDADAIYYNGVVYTVDSSFSVVSAFAVKDGKIIATGDDEAILIASRAPSPEPRLAS